MRIIDWYLGGKVLLIATAATAAAAGQTAAGEPKAVVELFTSQGCSSCPPADAVLGRLATDPDILALSYAVDYWDYLGWRDTFASTENSARQRDYAMSRGDNAVYTPQAVVNGQVHVIGSKEAKIRGEIAAQGEGLKVDVTAVLAGDRLIVTLPAVPKLHGEDPTIWLVTYEHAADVTIARGENTGRTVTYTNVVRRLQPIGMWSGEAMTIEYPMADLRREGADGCAVIVQANKDRHIGPILGAATVKLPTS
ncbi:DUF1223 domain-containing protein [Methylobrevis pamukkalensis]|uniref:DUF1223 domain-containing protein n=1 Tax=Methylobrevis pamukkalensis TaxID=1439726 RepID=A0A1E3H1V3_9HYPH|nr:DUF1223 domain-containing protein [Methylobrevis pamukkalensis]ODN70282.1 hypothetical protein A6302_02374 [Methylobrevis pamukkalensis]